MRIGIDGRMIGKRMHGIARYTFNLLREILKIDKKNRYSLLITDKFPYMNVMEYDNLTYLPMKSPFVSISEPFELHNVLKKESFDLFHSPSFIPPFYSGGPFIMTLHDMNHLINPGLSKKIYYKFIIKPYLRKAKRILTVSEYSKNEICRAFDLEEDRVSVVYDGVEDRFRPREDKTIKGIIKHYNLPDRFILTIGNEKKHKNLKLLLRALRDVNKDYPLVLNLEPKGHLMKDVIELGLVDRVNFIGYIDDADLPLLYNAASVFVFISLNEGFGLPPLEAMASGCPSVVSNISSLLEIYGDSAYYVDPTDVTSIATGINRVIEDIELRNTLKRKGLERAKRFRWEDAARRVLDLYEKACLS